MHWSRSDRIRILALTLAVLLPSLSVAQVKNKELPNFYRVNETLFRGGQPGESGFKQLSEMGIRTVVDLRDDHHSRSEAAKARSAGLRYFNLPLSSFERPAETTVAQALSIINSPENQPVFVHCNRGSDRTGVIIAIYRIEHDGWTSDEAKKEAKHFGLGFWQVHMKDYIGDYYRRKLVRLKQ